MYQSLIHENVLLNNIQIYIDDFYDVEKNEGKYNFALALLKRNSNTHLSIYRKSMD